MSHHINTRSRFQILIWTREEHAPFQHLLTQRHVITGIIAPIVDHSSKTQDVNIGVLAVIIL